MPGGGGFDVCFLDDHPGLQGVPGKRRGSGGGGFGKSKALRSEEPEPALAFWRAIRNRQSAVKTIMISEDEIKNALKAVKYPGFTRDIVSFGLVKQVTIGNGAVSVTLQLTSGSPEVAQQIKTESERALKALPGVSNVHVEVKAPTGAQATAAANPWQIHHFSEPRLRLEVSRSAGRAAGLRYLRAKHPLDDGHPRKTGRQRGSDDDGAAGESRHQVDEHGVPD
jgi:metal-sulfur cluster biosynthetic enzyme